MPRVGILGAGYWGPNLIRNFAALQNCELGAICDSDPIRRERIARQYASATLYSDYQDMLDDETLDAIVVATPVDRHYEHARRALETDKHVLVEKPLATSTRECLDLIRISEDRQRVLMVGHTFLYNAAVRKVKEMVEEGELGDVLYLYSQRLNLGIVRQDINAMWNLAPHDISIVGYLIGKDPLRVTARGFTYLQHGLPDVVFFSVEYAGGVAAHIHVSWLDPQKVRKMTIVGTRKMVVYDDVSVDAKLQIYDKGVDRINTNGDHKSAPAFGEYQLLVRSGNLLIPHVNFGEPLRTECAHFIECISGGRQPLSNGWDGLRVVAILEAAERSIKSGGSPVDLDASIFENASFKNASCFSCLPLATAS